MPPCELFPSLGCVARPWFKNREPPFTGNCRSEKLPRIRRHRLPYSLLASPPPRLDLRPSVDPRDSWLRSVPLGAGTSPAVAAVSGKKSSNSSTPSETPPFNNEPADIAPKAHAIRWGAHRLRLLGALGRRQAGRNSLALAIAEGGVRGRKKTLSKPVRRRNPFF